MHDQVRVGSPLEIAHPVNLFPLDKIARKHVLIAGGIGITPFLAQLEDLHGGAVPYELHYSVRSPEHAAFLSRLRAREGERLHMYYDSESQAIDFDGLLSAPAARHPCVRLRAGRTHQSRDRHRQGVGLAGQPHPLGAVRGPSGGRRVRSVPGPQQTHRPRSRPTKA